MSFNTLVLAPFSQEGLAALKQLGRVTYEPWTATRELRDPAELGRKVEAEAFHGLVVEADFLFDELFAAAPTLRFAAVCRGSLNQVELDSATRHGVAIVHAPGRNAQAVAELVLALMLGLARHMPHAVSYVREGAWHDPVDAYVRFQGRELAGATLGVIGMGEIGRRVARLGQAIGMRIVANDPYLSPALAPPEHVLLAGLDDLLGQCDFLSIHVPDTPETDGLLSEKRLRRMRAGSYLVNVTAPS
ncbi:MAG: NAD(P)-dependent oxidoreductase, partial [Dehalococcoidia bacterium]